MSTTNITAAINDMLFTPGLDLDTALDRHFAPDYRQRTDNRWDDRAQFAAHIAHLREVVADGHVEVHQELCSGTAYADRHTVDVRKKDGSSVRMEVYLFGEFAADGRFRRIEETTLQRGGPGSRQRTLTPGTARPP
jgi:ketosteroid isomerase-like protein